MQVKVWVHVRALDRFEVEVKARNEVEAEEGSASDFTLSSPKLTHPHPKLYIPKPLSLTSPPPSCHPTLALVFTLGH